MSVRSRIHCDRRSRVPDAATRAVSVQIVESGFPPPLLKPETTGLGRDDHRAKGQKAAHQSEHDGPCVMAALRLPCDFGTVAHVRGPLPMREPVACGDCAIAEPRHRQAEQVQPILLVHVVSRDVRDGSSYQ